MRLTETIDLKVLKKITNLEKISKQVYGKKGVAYNIPMKNQTLYNKFKSCINQIKYYFTK